MQDLTIALIQMELAWEDWEANRDQAEIHLRGLSSDVDLVLLPEMFGSGFTMRPARVAQKMDGPAAVWMAEMSQHLNATIMGSLVIEDDGAYYNRLLSVHADGTINYYDKRHLFSYAKENENYSAGTHRLIDTVRGWRVCPLVCYDLRFPVWSRNSDDFDLLVYVANWPGPRIAAWEALLKARAIENLCYTAGLNRIGTDANDISYPGLSSVYDHTGVLLHRCGDLEEVAVVRLDRQKMLDFRAAYNFLADRDIYVMH